jgi:hypothetical protein
VSPIFHSQNLCRHLKKVENHWLKQWKFNPFWKIETLLRVYVNKINNTNVLFFDRARKEAKKRICVCVCELVLV